MGFFDRLLGREPKDPYQQYGPYGSQSGQAPTAAPQYGAQPTPHQEGASYSPQVQPAQQAGNRTPDEVAIDRYKYMLRTAPPDAVEQAHAEAFEKLTPEQRRKVLEELNSQVPEHERTASDDPRDLARTATRAEMRDPGTLQRSFGGPSFGAMLGSSLLGTVAGVVIGSAVANALFGPTFGDPSQEHAADAEADGAEEAGAEEAGAEEDSGASEEGAGGEESGADAGADAGDAGAVEASAADAGGDGGDGGGFFGGLFGGGGDDGGGFFGGDGGGFDLGGGGDF
ncbi:hypothetical protein GCM10028784_38310 [Myceligenerans cantabricum]